MTYWNQPAFEGLLELAQELRRTPELSALADYCELREKGVRGKALARLNEFLDEAARWDTTRARRNLLLILEANARFPDVNQFLTHALLMRFVYPSLEQWAADEPEAGEPFRWLGLLRSEPDDLRRALSLMPDDVPVRSRLIISALDVADYATHHLGESIFLSTVENTREAIATARQLIDSAPDSEPFFDLSARADLFEQMVDDWVAYSESPEGSFPEWCDAQGRTYGWPATFYYGQPD